jgi:hypothetical protein
VWPGWRLQFRLDGGCHRCCCQPGVGTDETGASASADAGRDAGTERGAAAVTPRTCEAAVAVTGLALSKGSFASSCCFRSFIVSVIGN